MLNVNVHRYIYLNLNYSTNDFAKLLYSNIMANLGYMASLPDSSGEIALSERTRGKLRTRMFVPLFFICREGGPRPPLVVRHSSDRPSTPREGVAETPKSRERGRNYCNKINVRTKDFNRPSLVARQR